MQVLEISQNKKWDSKTPRQRFTVLCETTIISQKKRSLYSRQYWHELPINIQNRINKVRY